MERVFLTDFARVRVHTGAEASTLTETLGARAFTTDRHVFVHGGESVPSSGSGTNRERALLAHELTHVVQQGGHLLGEGSGEAVQRKTGNIDTTALDRMQQGDVPERLAELQRALREVAERISLYNAVPVGVHSRYDVVTLELILESISEARGHSMASEPFLSAVLALDNVEWFVQRELAAVERQLDEPVAADPPEQDAPASSSSARPAGPAPAAPAPSRPVVSPAPVPSLLAHQQQKAKKTLSTKKKKRWAKKAANTGVAVAKKLPFSGVGELAAVLEWVVRGARWHSTEIKRQGLNELRTSYAGVSAMDVASESLPILDYLIEQKTKKKARALQAGVGLLKAKHAVEKGQDKGTERTAQAVRLRLNANQGDRLALQIMGLLLGDEVAMAVLQDPDGKEGLALLMDKMKSS